MPEPSEVVSQVSVKLDGSDLPTAVIQNLQEVVVDQHAQLPDMFTIRLSDPDLELLDNGPFDLARSVSIEAGNDEGKRVTLIEGENTALEPSFDDGMIAELVVHGYDPSHRLYRETRSVAHLNKKDSDLATEIAQAAGLKAEVDTTSMVYDHIYQHNQSDLAFLMERAWRIGYECFVADGTLRFLAPLSGSAEVTLTWGKDLLSFRPRMTLGEQVDEVIVRGWDVETQAAIVGRAEKGGLYPQVEEPKDGAEWASSAFGPGKRTIVDQPVASQAEADTLAAARLDELSGAFVEAEGTAFRRPEIKAGRAVRLEALGKRFSGTYLVTSATHVYSAEGLTTTFSVRGSRTGQLAELMGQHTGPERRPGVVSAVVTNTDDPKDWGRVKVKYPWLSDEAESDWARVVGPGAGPEVGAFALPEVDDEVLVVFGHGDFGQPFVLGGLWNGRHSLPPEAARAKRGEKPLVRTWRSRSGHRVTLRDDDKNKIEVMTAGGQSFTLDDAKGSITISTKSGLAIVLDDRGRKISVESKGDLEVKAGGNMDLRAGGQLNLMGATINLNLD